jgi:NAD(P)H-dependent flavin oxidoreductase YrpB (nitropropane dioxygenase family)
MSVLNDSTVPARLPARLPVLIQGGMGVGVSSWQLASAVSRAGQLGVVSGTALDVVLARRLQDGDPDGLARAALADLPLRDLADRVLGKWFHDGGRAPGRPYAPIPRLGVRANAMRDDLTVAGNFVEVWLAKHGHDGVVGINFLEKIQMATPAAAYGAMLAGVDVVLMGAGIPREIPALLDALAAGRPGGVAVDVAGGETVRVALDPAALTEGPLPPVHRPAFLAIVSAHVLAAYLCREDSTRPDGFVVEGPSAGGHNAPPRGKLVLDEQGEPVYGPRDEADLRQMARLGLPFWLAGGYGSPERVRAALADGAAGVQVGTLFALSQESGLLPHLRDALLDALRSEDLRVRTDPAASPTGFPFKVADVPGTLSDPEVYDARPRLCDLGYLRQPFARSGGEVGYRCPAEPVDVYVRKGGTAEEAEGAKCLCNALTTDVGLGQQRKDGYTEVPLVTLGSDLAGAKQLDAERWLVGRSDAWTAQDAVEWLLRQVNGPAAPAGTAQSAQSTQSTQTAEQDVRA